MKVPGTSKVDKALLTLKNSLKGCLNEVNQQAGKLLAKGDYARSESLVDVAKSVEAYRTEVESLRSRWRTIKGARREPKGGKQTPLWEYYRPILEALVELGGTARVGDLQQRVGNLMNARFSQEDLRTMAGGRPRFHVMIRRARKHMVSEGFLEDSTGLEWRITAAGRKATEAGRNKKG